MTILITGICGFVGSSLALALRERVENLTIIGADNFIRPGSETNRLLLKRLGIRVFHADIRQPSDFDALPAADWVIDAAANPSVLAGVDGRSSSRQLIEHNLGGTINLLEYCKMYRAGLVLLSTSRVYSIVALNQVKLLEQGTRFVIDTTQPQPPHLTPAGVSEEFSTASPISLYGASKLASEVLALDYGATFQFPVWINRCGVLAGPGQLGTAEQGIFSFWLHAHARRRPLRYIGFTGLGHQVRDALHPRDLAALLQLQLTGPSRPGPRLFNVSGGQSNSLSLAQLTSWCDERFGPHPVQSDLAPRPFDIPWLILDSALASSHFDWRPQTSISSLLDEIGHHVDHHPDWLELTAPQ